MNKILLLGTATDGFINLKGILEKDFNVTNCKMVLHNVQGMMKIVKPELVVAYFENPDDQTTEVMGWIDENYDSIPVLEVSPQKFFEKYEYINIEDAKENISGKCFELITGESNVPVKLKKLLIVDDAAVALRNFNELLKDNYEIVLATSGEQAIKQLKEHHPDMVLLDYEMPGMNGVETFERMRNEEEGKDIPIVFLTGVSDKDKVVNILTCRPDGYILKPPSAKKIIMQIEDILYSKEHNLS